MARRNTISFFGFFQPSGLATPFKNASGCCRLPIELTGAMLRHGILYVEHILRNRFAA